MQTPASTYPSWGQPLLGGSAFTAADVERLPNDGYHYEVYRGALIRMPGAGEDHALICQFIGEMLAMYWRGRGERFRIVQNMGFDFTVPGDLPETTMLVPDVAVKSDNQRHGPGIGQAPPLIAIEVAASSDSRPALVAKARYYLARGVAEVWLVWLKPRTLEIWTAPDATTVYAEQETCVSAQLPGWSGVVRAMLDGE